MENKNDILKYIDDNIYENITGNISATVLNAILKKLCNAIFENNNIQPEPAPPVEEDVIELTGALQYNMANASGGTITPLNTLKLLVNDVQQTVTFNYSILNNEIYTFASVDQNGNVTFQNSTSSNQRNVTVIVSCVYNGETYSKPFIASQKGYVAPTETKYVYASWVKNTETDLIQLSQFTNDVKQNSTNKTINCTVNKIANVIACICPSSMSLQNITKQGAILDDITSKMTMTEGTYEGQSVKLYQYKYGGNLNGESFIIKFQ